MLARVGGWLAAGLDERNQRRRRRHRRQRQRRQRAHTQAARLDAHHRRAERAAHRDWRAQGQRREVLRLGHDAQRQCLVAQIDLAAHAHGAVGVVKHGHARHQHALANGCVHSRAAQRQRPVAAQGHAQRLGEVQPKGFGQQVREGAVAHHQAGVAVQGGKDLGHAAALPAERELRVQEAGHVGLRRRLWRLQGGLPFTLQGRRCGGGLGCCCRCAQALDPARHVKPGKLQRCRPLRHGGSGVEPARPAHSAAGHHRRQVVQLQRALAQAQMRAHLAQRGQRGGAEVEQVDVDQHIGIHGGQRGQVQRLVGQHPPGSRGWLVGTDGRSQVLKGQPAAHEAPTEPRGLGRRVVGKSAGQHTAADAGALGHQAPQTAFVRDAAAQIEGGGLGQHQAQRLPHRRQRRPAELQCALQARRRQQRSRLAVEHQMSTRHSCVHCQARHRGCAAAISQQRQRGSHPRPDLYRRRAISPFCHQLESGRCADAGGLLRLQHGRQRQLQRCVFNDQSTGVDLQPLDHGCRPWRAGRVGTGRRHAQVPTGAAICQADQPGVDVLRLQRLDAQCSALPKVPQVAPAPAQRHIVRGQQVWR